jgi:hypothetical protein
MINDWVADELWMMRWLTWDCTFDVARAELVTRVAIARLLIEQLVRRGLRSDHATAEAVMIIVVNTCSVHWGAVVDVIANDPSPAQELFPRPRRAVSGRRRKAAGDGPAYWMR